MLLFPLTPPKSSTTTYILMWLQNQKRTLTSDSYRSELGSEKFKNVLTGQECILSGVGLWIKCHLTQSQCVIRSTEAIEDPRELSWSPSKSFPRLIRTRMDYLLLNNKGVCVVVGEPLILSSTSLINPKIIMLNERSQTRVHTLWLHLNKFPENTNSPRVTVVSSVVAWSREKIGVGAKQIRTAFLTKITFSK